MSVIIKGMKMPSGCDKCDWKFWSNLYQVYTCELTKKALGITDGTKQRSYHCPLIEIPKGARLIDANEVEEKISIGLQEPDYQHESETWTVGLIMARDYLDDVPTIFEENEE